MNLPFAIGVIGNAFAAEEINRITRSILENGDT